MIKKRYIDVLVDYYYDKFKTFEGFKESFLEFLQVDCKNKINIKKPENLANYYYKVYSKLSPEEQKKMLYAFILGYKIVVNKFLNYKFREVKEFLTKIKVDISKTNFSNYYLIYIDDPPKIILYNESTKEGVNIKGEKSLNLLKYLNIKITPYIKKELCDIYEYQKNIS